MKSTFCSPPYNNVRDAFIQLRRAGKYNKIIASPVIEKLLPLGPEIGFATRFGPEKEKKIPGLPHPGCSLFLEEYLNVLIP